MRNRRLTSMQGTLLAVGDTSSSGLVSIWDTVSWQRKQTLKVRPTSDLQSLAATQQQLALSLLSCWCELSHSCMAAMYMPGRSPGVGTGHER